MQQPVDVYTLGLNNKYQIINPYQLSAYLDTHHPDTIILENDKSPILFTAIFELNLELVQLLLKRGANVNYTNHNTCISMTPLIAALYWSSTESDPTRQSMSHKIIHEILTHKPDLNVCDKFGDTALIVACWAEHHENIALTLIDHGADVHQVTDSNLIQLKKADAFSTICRKQTKNYAVQKRLIELGAHKGIIARTGAAYELYRVAGYNNYLTRELVNAGANVYWKTWAGIIDNILQQPELSDIWQTVINKIKPDDVLPIFTNVIAKNNKFVDQYIIINETKIFDHDFIAAAAYNNCTRPIKRYLFNLLFGQFNRKKLNKYITNHIIAFTCGESLITV
jgi:hypothetical protein